MLTRPLILASASPRRAALLAQIGLSFQVVVSNIEEPPPTPQQDVMHWAKSSALDKALAVAEILEATPAFILGADTVVLLPWLDDPCAPHLNMTPVRVLGKPLDIADAVAMLHALSGCDHLVLSAFAILTHPDGTFITDAVITRVRFRNLSDAEIDAYIASGEPLDKAGAYAIQGRGAVFIEEIIGDYYTVVGLPLTRVWQQLVLSSNGS